MNKPTPNFAADVWDADVPVTTDFAVTDLESLRNELLQSGLDSWQAGELVTSFLAVRGYGVSAGEARQVATRMEAGSCSLECMRQELGRLALVM